MGLGQLGMMAASTGVGLLEAGWQDRRQRKQQEKLQRIQIEGSKEMLEAQRKKEMQMWQDTSYPAQMKMMKEAGLNPSLMYGMGGGGGTTVGGSGSGVSGAAAPSGGGEVGGAVGMGIQAGQLALQTKAQTELLQAQKAKIEAETANLGADTTYTAGAKTANTEQDTKLKVAQDWETSLRAAMQDYMQSHNGKGEFSGMTGSIAATERITEIMLKNENMKKIGEEIALMKAKGLTEGQVYENLKKEGKLKDVEIEWNALDLTSGNEGKFLTNLIKWMFKR